MSEIKKTYTEEAGSKRVHILIENELLGLTNHKSLNEIVSEEISAGVKDISFDFSNLTYISSSGIGILISNLKSINTSGCSLKIENANEKILNIFKISKLEKIFNLNS